MVHESFKAWVEEEVRQLPPNTQLDGGSVPSRAIVARFVYNQAVWQVHGDTRVDVVLKAYNHLCANPDSTPFVVELTEARGKRPQRDCLNLIPELRTSKRGKYFYAYRE